MQGPPVGSCYITKGQDYTSKKVKTALHAKIQEAHLPKMTTHLSNRFAHSLLYALAWINEFLRLKQREKKDAVDNLGLLDQMDSKFVTYFKRKTQPFWSLLLITKTNHFLNSVAVRRIENTSFIAKALKKCSLQFFSFTSWNIGHSPTWSNGYCSETFFLHALTRRLRANIIFHFLRTAAKLTI